jgi:hypothetical protein
MVNGQEAFRAIEGRFPLYEGGEASGHAFEVFPHASAVVFAGHALSRPYSKVSWRREVLLSKGVGDPRLSSADLVDAALAALTGLFALEARFCWFGEPAEGVILLPCAREELPARFGARS